jgi:hypothetical protein
MHTDEIMKYGIKNINFFKGVFPLDRLPKYIEKPANFVVNTDSHSLPGEHWLAASYSQRGIVYLFDPFGFFYPKLLILRLNKLHPRKIIFNKQMIQKPWEKNCGQLCLKWLESRHV